MDYLTLEGIWCLRANAGRARTGGRFLKLPKWIADTVRGFLFEKDINPHTWDGSVRIGEQWLSLAPAGTADVIASIPAGRPAWDETLGEYVTLKAGRTAFIETKSTTGRLSKEQQDFKRLALKRGELFYVIRDMDELRRVIPPKRELNFYA
jgi:hypothetical protein